MADRAVSVLNVQQAAIPSYFQPASWAVGLVVLSSQMGSVWATNHTTTAAPPSEGLSASELGAILGSIGAFLLVIGGGVAWCKREVIDQWCCNRTNNDNDLPADATSLSQTNARDVSGNNNQFSNVNDHSRNIDYSDRSTTVVHVYGEQIRYGNVKADDSSQKTSPSTSRKKKKKLKRKKSREPNLSDTETERQPSDSDEVSALSSASIVSCSDSLASSESAQAMMGMDELAAQLNEGWSREALLKLINWEDRASQFSPGPFQKGFNDDANVTNLIRSATDVFSAMRSFLHQKQDLSNPTAWQYLAIKIKQAMQPLVSTSKRRLICAYVRVLEESARLGSAPSSATLARLFLKGESMVLAEDPLLAMAWFEVASMQSGNALEEDKQAAKNLYAEFLLHPARSYSRVNAPMIPEGIKSSLFQDFVNEKPVKAAMRELANKGCYYAKYYLNEGDMMVDAARGGLPYAQKYLARNADSEIASFHWWLQAAKSNYNNADARFRVACALHRAGYPNADSWREASSKAKYYSEPHEPQQDYQLAIVANGYGLWPNCSNPCTYQGELS